MRTLAIANQKGGVGKTATTHALGVALASQGCHVLMVDLDPQGSLTVACGVEETAGRSIAELMESTTPGIPPLPRVIRPLMRGLSLIPSDVALAITEQRLVARAGREKVLKRVLTSVAAYYHVCLLDCPPSMGMLTTNALTASDAVLIPTQPQAADLAALELFLETVDAVRSTLNPQLKVLGILVTFYDGRLNHHREILHTLEERKLPIMHTKVGRSIRVAEAVGLRQSLLAYASENIQAENYRQLAKEILPWVNRLR
jgi:chromosome partitioning protein